MFYDCIILGGGISGLYLAYKLHLLYPNKKVVLVEKERHLGGRVYTYYDSKMTVEMGAGRFCFQHVHLMELIRELGLAKNIMKIGSNMGLYAPSDGTGSMQPNKLYLKKTGGEGYGGSGGMEGSGGMGGEGLLQKVIQASKKEKKEDLMKQSFSSYALQILSKEDVQYIKDSFGYYSELVLMNAFDAIVLLEEFKPEIEYYSLHGGLMQIIFKMEAKLTGKNVHRKMSSKHGGAWGAEGPEGARGAGYTRKQVKKVARKVRIMRHKKVLDIKPIFGEMGGSGFEVYIKGSQEIIRGKTCICALPKQALYKMKVFEGTHVPRMLDSIQCGSLCRIYSIFDKNHEGKVWFQDYSKFTTNNELRMVIPIDVKSGVIMTSYSDNIYADYWHDLYVNSGVGAVNKRLKELMKESLGVDIPMPKHTKVFYWKCGVGYWGVGANSAVISHQIQKPFDELDLYICGEHYSSTHQQWMEGALETAHQVLGFIGGGG